MSWERNLDKEIREHIEQAAADYVAQGMDPREARNRARADFGSVELAKDEVRDTRALRWLADFAQDVRYALRGFRRSPGFAVTVIAVLALAIGANTTVFTLMHRVLLASLPVESPDELVELSCTNPLELDEVGCGSSYPGYNMFAERTDLFTGTFAFAQVDPVNVMYQGTGGVASGLLATGDFFNVLGVAPAAGRLFVPSDDQRESAPTAVLSYAYWQRRFGADPEIIGKTVRVNSTPVTIVGVTPRAFRNVTFDLTPDLTFPLVRLAPDFYQPAAIEARDDWWLRIVGRRRPGVSFARVQAALEPVYRRTVEDMIDALGSIAPPTLRDSLQRFRFSLQPAARGAASEMRRDLGRPLRILMGAVAIVLLIACANLTGLMITRAAARRRELGVRLALGAGRMRITRQMLTESLLLAFAGGAAGLLVSAWMGTLLLRLAAGEPGLRAIDTAPEPAVLAFTAAVSLVAALLLGLLPAVRLAVYDPQSSLRPAATPAAQRSVRLLIPAQVALTAVLVVGAVLFLRTFENFRHVDLGFDAGELLSFSASPELLNYDEASSRAYFTTLRKRLEALPGVDAVTVSRNPMGNISNRTAVHVDGFDAEDFNDQMISRNYVGARFVETTGLRLLHGRDLREDDQTGGGVLAAIVNESFARHFFQEAGAVGRRFFMSTGPTGALEFAVVGVVADARDRGPKTAPERTIYVPLGNPELSTVVTLRARDAAAQIPAVRTLLREVDAAVPVRDMQTAQALAESQLSRERLLALLSAAFGALALLLVAVGLYGLIAGGVAARTRELGIRISLGARPAQVAWLVTRQSLALVLAGGVAGLAAGALLARFIEAQLFGVAPTDPSAYGAAAGLLTGIAALAAYLPARRATRVDPATALRCE